MLDLIFVATSKSCKLMLVLYEGRLDCHCQMRTHLTFSRSFYCRSDFGLATELKDSKKADDGLYKLTGMTGSPRYMAPEVALEQHYNEKCDVWSFALMLWQMYALKTPFELYSMKLLKSRVWAGEKKRPAVDASWSVPVKNLLKRAWSHDLQQRPGFSQVSKILRAECVRVRDGNEDGLEHNRRRSTFVFRGSRGQLDTTKKTTRLSEIQKAVVEEKAVIEEYDASESESNPARTQEQPVAPVAVAAQ